MESIIYCESKYNPLARGDSGHSRGLVQIDDLFHPKITHAQAYSPYFSIEYLAKELAKGNGPSEWSCYPKHLANSS